METAFKLLAKRDVMSELSNFRREDSIGDLTPHFSSQRSTDSLDLTLYDSTREMQLDGSASATERDGQADRLHRVLSEQLSSEFTHRIWTTSTNLTTC